MPWLQELYRHLSRKTNAATRVIEAQVISLAHRLSSDGAKPLVNGLLMWSRPNKTVDVAFNNAWSPLLRGASGVVGDTDDTTALITALSNSSWGPACVISEDNGGIITRVNDGGFDFDESGTYVVTIDFSGECTATASDRVIATRLANTVDSDNARGGGFVIAANSTALSYSQTFIITVSDSQVGDRYQVQAQSLGANVFGVNQVNCQISVIRANH